MESLPNIPHYAHDQSMNVKYVVFAYQALSESQVKLFIEIFRKSNKISRNSFYRIYITADQSSIL